MDDEQEVPPPEAAPLARPLLLVLVVRDSDTPVPRPVGPTPRSMPRSTRLRKSLWAATRQRSSLATSPTTLPRLLSEYVFSSLAHLQVSYGR